MTPTQKKTLVYLLLLGVLYFGIFIWPNSLGAQTEGMLAKTSVDEPVTYPYVIRMVAPPHDLREAVNRWIIYGDYHYGYPFYFFSAVVVLPVSLAHGSLFENFTPLNLLLLRQLISVLPMILAAGTLVFAQTRFQSVWKSILLFVLLLSIRAVVRSDIQWWHPDALSVLAVVLTLLLLERDRLRFGKYFLWAAVVCAFAVSIKLAGVFFAPAIALYLLTGLWRKRLNLAQAAVKAALFLGIMCLAILVTNPFLINSGARAELVNIQTFKTVELDQGYTHDDPYYYGKGPSFWEWTLKTWYAQPLLLAFLGLSLLVGCLWGQRKTFNRLVLAWVIPYSIYLLWFVAVKPDHYWLPILLPVYSAALSLWEVIPATIHRVWQFSHFTVRWDRVLQVSLLAILAAHFVWNLARPYSGAVTRYQEALTVETGW
jgi:hypothetical protein